MYYSYSLSKSFVSIPLLTIQLFFIQNVLSLNLTNTYLHHICRVNQGKYTPGSQYEQNFKNVTRDFDIDAFKYGFVHTFHGEAPNVVSVIFECRGDSYESKCRSCLATAISGFRKKCHRNKGGIIWYDQCFLDVSTINPPFPRKMSFENTFSMYNPKNVKGDTESFQNDIKLLFYKLMVKADKAAPDGVNLLNYAARIEDIGVNKVYAMVQCAKDIVECSDCLERLISELPKCCANKQGARVLNTKCNIRYEMYPFLRT